MKFDFWDNYHNMLDVIIWKKKFIQPIWDNQGIPLKLLSVKLSSSKIWALMSIVNGAPQINNIEIVYSQRSIPLQQKAMQKLVEAYFKAYRDHLTDGAPQ